MFVFIFLISFQNVGLCFCHHMWDESLGFCYEPLVSPTTWRERICLFCKRGKKEKKYPTTCAWRYMGKGVCCLVKINMHTASKGTSYFVIWNIQVIDLKRRNCPWLNQRQTWKTKAPTTPSISLQRYKICMFSEVVSSIDCCEVVWNFGMPSTKCFFEAPPQERFSKSSISTISAIVRWLPKAYLATNSHGDQSETTPIFQKEYKYRHTYYVGRYRKKAHWRPWTKWWKDG